MQRYGKYRRKLFFAARGVDRLATRSYVIYPRNDGSSRFVPRFLVEADPNHYKGTSKGESRQRTLQKIFLGFKAYRETPCAVPNCPCMIHRLGVPQAAEVYEVFPPGGRKK